MNGSDRSHAEFVDGTKNELKLRKNKKKNTKHKINTVPCDVRKMDANTHNVNSMHECITCAYYFCGKGIRFRVKRKEE